MAENKKYYWLKLQRDFFKRHDIRIIEAMENGKDYILFYLKLLVESIDHEGLLRFSDTIPYNETMLATITNTNVDVVRSAMKVFTELNMIDVLEDKTIFMTEVEKMIGSATNDEQREQWRIRQQRHREKVKMQDMSRDSHVKLSREIEKEIEKEIEIEKDNIGVNKSPKRFIPPTVDEVRAYCEERNNNVDAESFVDFYESKGWYVGKNKMKDWKSAVRTWERNRSGSNRNDRIANRVSEVDSWV